MYIESLKLENFQCFGPDQTVINLDEGLTAFVGANGSGKTAACRALLRLFGLSAEDRTVRPDDFHVPANEQAVPDTRELTIEAVLAFPELRDDNEGGKGAVPEFFHRMAATDNGELKCRIVLQATWEADGTLDGSVSETRRVVRTFAEEYDEEEWVTFPNAERARIQMIYIPASRDGARQVTSFLRSRLWRAARWSAELRSVVATTTAALAEKFHEEPATSVIEATLTSRWRELHDADTHAMPQFRPLESDFNQLLRSTELVFEPDHTSNPRPARLLSDGQRSLLHLALTATTLDIEAEVAAGARRKEFDLGSAHLPTLTLVAVEEPENSLTPFFLSRIITQMTQLCESRRAQVVIASHSAGIMHRIAPENVRHFRLDLSTSTAVVRPITLPTDGSEAGKYVREAVRAHPELYFAKFVVLGEGDSEQIVIPRIAQAQGVPLDPSFVAMVPLGGRHTNHFWRLLNDLHIPHATLLDLDLGRSGGGVGRLRDACNRLLDADVAVFDELDGYDSIEDLTDDLPADQWATIVYHIQKFRVFFSAPLDLDYTMLVTFWDAYTALDDGETGPQYSDPTKTVLGAEGIDHPYWNPSDKDALDQQLERLRWYRYLFLSRSKPTTHFRGLAQLDDDKLKQGTKAINGLIDTIRAELSL